MSDSVPIPVFYGRIENGQFRLQDREAFARLKASLEGVDIEIRLSRRRKDRSSPQNRYYHGVVVKMLSEFTGHTCDEIHTALKNKFLVERGDEQLPRVRSTASLNVQEFARYVDDCIRLAAELGVVIPDSRHV